MHFQRCKDSRMNVPEKSRNGFWVRVLQNTNPHQHVRFKLPRQDAETTQLNDNYRSLQPVHHLKLGVVPRDKKPGPDETYVNEEQTAPATIVSCFLSESVSVIACRVAALKFRSALLALYFLVPLVVRLILVAFSVRRTGLISQKELQQWPRRSAQPCQYRRPSKWPIRSTSLWSLRDRNRLRFNSSGTTVTRDETTTRFGWVIG